MTLQEIYIQLRNTIIHRNIDPSGILVHPKVYADLEYELFKKSTYPHRPLTAFGKEILRSYDVGENEVKFIM